MEKIPLLELLLFCIIGEILCHVDFTGHKLYGLIASDEEELKFLKQLSKDEKVDTWEFPTSVNEKMTVRVAPDVIEHLEKELNSNGIDFYVLHDNIQKMIDREREENILEGDTDDILSDLPLNVYHTLETINAYIDFVASHYAEIAEVINFGTTVENNTLKGLKIGTPRTNKSAIWIDAGMHAREWLAPATALYIIDQLVKGIENDAEIRQLLDIFDWYIFPVVNPDGYIYSWTLNRMWRKNMSPPTAYPFFSELLESLMYAIKTTDTLCVGVDLNRNFDASFGGNGSETHPCRENYQGVSAFSEAESSAIRDGVLRLGSSLKAYLSLHSFMQVWLAPDSNTTDLPPDHADHMAALKIVSDAIYNVHGVSYEYGTLSQIAKVHVPGNSIDWAYATAGVKYSFAVELRHTGKEGFIQRSSQIIPTAEENFAGIKALAHHIRSEMQ